MTEIRDVVADAVLTDSFGRKHDYLRISLTDRCNLRCTYCMPEEQQFSPSASLMSAEEIDAIAAVFVRHGVKKIRLTGGEPFARKDAGEIIQRLSGLPVELTLTTNATLVHRYIGIVTASGVRSLNVSLDTFSRQKFLQLTRRDEYQQVMDNIQLLIDRNVRLKLNVVAMKGVNDDELIDFVSFTQLHDVHVRFIEFMPFAGNSWERSRVIGYREMLDMIAAAFPIKKLHDEPHSTAKAWHVPGYRGTFAFINTITAPFCGDCNRLRLTADGKMKNCLFSASEMDLLSALRKGNNIEELIMQSVLAKKERSGGQDLTAKVVNRSMVAIGG